MPESRTSTPTHAQVLMALAEFQHGMPEPGHVTIALVAAKFCVSWITAAHMIAEAKLAMEESV